ncbi:PREDICTED: uncharacterized protein LOC104602745 [Nelumbo nucifera]|uniref:Uncharacterized protein LOC104602745 n=1 Tax=Nelumbo nucifera TaxID=4432 RepID=A0A1U8AGI2_NELNU|nr:PREDICTED: uncharacterized protein LOC104602745 [Nelumbo nucifera]
MESQQLSWRSLRFSFRNATILVCFFNLVTVLLLLQGFLSGLSNKRVGRDEADAVQLRYINECDELRRAMEPLELIKRVKEIKQEVYAEPDIVQPKDNKQTAAVDLSKRLMDFRALNDANSVKALEEWRKRKMERARQRELGKNGTALSQARNPLDI